MSSPENRYQSYECEGCGETRRLRRNSTRIRAPCPECELVTSQERIEVES